MKIRKATIHDLHKVGRLFVKLINETMPKDAPNVEWWRKSTASAMQSKSYFMFVAEEGGAIVGFTSFSVMPDAATGTIQAVGRHIYVETEYRNGKVGALLHKENLRCAKENGAQSWVLICTDNEKPVWMKKGFVPINQNILIKRLEA